MTSEELERTGVLKAILDKDIENEETTIGERIEEFEDKLEYIMTRIFDSGIVGDGNYIYFDDLKRVLGEILCNDNKEDS